MALPWIFHAGDEPPDDQDDQQPPPETAPPPTSRALDPRIQLPAFTVPPPGMDPSPQPAPIVQQAPVMQQQQQYMQMPAQYVQQGMQMQPGMVMQGVPMQQMQHPQMLNMQQPPPVMQMHMPPPMVQQQQQPMYQQPPPMYQQGMLVQQGMVQQPIMQPMQLQPQMQAQPMQQQMWMQPPPSAVPQQVQPQQTPPTQTPPTQAPGQPQQPMISSSQLQNILLSQGAPDTDLRSQQPPPQPSPASSSSGLPTTDDILLKAQLAAQKHMMQQQHQQQAQMPPPTSAMQQISMPQSQGHVPPATSVPQQQALSFSLGAHTQDPARPPVVQSNPDERMSREDEERDKRRDRRRRSRSRSRERRRRSPSTSRDRDRKRHRSRSRDRERRRRSRSGDRAAEKEASEQEQQTAAMALANPPGPKLFISNLPISVKEETLSSIFACQGFVPKAVRVVPRKHKSAPHSIGFVDFHDTPTAMRWMDANQYHLTLENGLRVSVGYAKPDRPPQEQPLVVDMEWTCAKCTVTNGAEVGRCPQCGCDKDESTILEAKGAAAVGFDPCDTLVLRDLPFSASDRLVHSTLQKTTHLPAMQVYMAKSKQFCYVQMRTVEEAGQLLKQCTSDPMRLDGAVVTMSYSRLPLSVVISEERAKEAKAMASRMRDEHMKTMQMMNPNAPPMGRGVVGQVDTPRGKMNKYAVPVLSTYTLEPSSGYLLDPVTHFYYDTATKYHFNTTTQKWCYWEPTYQTYFDVQSEAEKREESRGAEPMDEMRSKASNVAKDMMKWAQKQEKEKEKMKVQLTLKPKTSGSGLETKSAFGGGRASAAVDPSQLVNKEVTMKMLDRAKNPLAHVGSDDDDEEGDEERREAAAAHAGDPRRRGLGELPGSISRPSAVFNRAPVPTPQSTEPVIESAAAQRERMERELIDERNKSCLLCRRAFPNVETLHKHVEKSDLHKKNLVEKHAEWSKAYVAQLLASGGGGGGGGGGGSSAPLSSAPSYSSSRGPVYRDRARERRNQYGLDADGLTDHSNNFGESKETAAERARVASERNANRPLDDSNVGSRLLKQMGWREGQGAGKNGQGIVAPVEAERYVQGAGIGSSGARVTSGVNASHKERVRAAMAARYRDM